MSERAFRTNGTVVRSRDAARRREVVTEADAQDPRKVADLLTRLVNALEEIVRRITKPSMVFEDVTCTAGQQVKLIHGFGCRVRWWVVDWVASAEVDLRNVHDVANSQTTDNMLVLYSQTTGTASIRVEAI